MRTRKLWVNDGDYVCLVVSQCHSSVSKDRGLTWESHSSSSCPMWSDERLSDDSWCLLWLPGYIPEIINLHLVFNLKRTIIGKIMLNWCGDRIDISMLYWTNICKKNPTLHSLQRLRDNGNLFFFFSARGDTFFKMHIYVLWCQFGDCRLSYARFRCLSLIWKLYFRSRTDLIVFHTNFKLKFNSSRQWVRTLHFFLLISHNLCEGMHFFFPCHQSELRIRMNDSIVSHFTEHAHCTVILFLMLSQKI